LREGARPSASRVLLNHAYSFLGVESYEQSSTEPIPIGDVIVKMPFEAEEAQAGRWRQGDALANGKQIGEGRLEKTAPVACSSYAGMDIGRHNGLVVDLAYEHNGPYAFTGTGNQVVFDFEPAIHEDEHALHQHVSLHAVAHGVSA